MLSVLQRCAVMLPVRVEGRIAIWGSVELAVAGVQVRGFSSSWCITFNVAALCIAVLGVGWGSLLKQGRRL
jgi:hypothetical protein